MKTRRINICTRNTKDVFRFKEYYVDTNIDEGVIYDMATTPCCLLIQMEEYVRMDAICTLNEVFVRRPDATLRIYKHYGSDYSDWDLSFLSLMPDVRKLILEFPEYQETDLSILKVMDNLKELTVEIFNRKDYGFIDIIPISIEKLWLNADMQSGKPKFDCRKLLRFSSLKNLSLAKIETNLECITELKDLRQLGLRAIKLKDLSFLNQMQIESLSVSWCDSAKVDFNSLQDIMTLRHLQLLNIRKLYDISFICTFPKLEHLELIWMGALVKLPDFSMLKHLKDVELDTVNKLIDISGLLNVQNLERVKMTGKGITKESASVILQNPNIRTFLCYGAKGGDIRFEREENK